MWLLHWVSLPLDWWVWQYFWDFEVPKNKLPGDLDGVVTLTLTILVHSVQYGIYEAIYKSLRNCIGSLITTE